MKEMRDATFVLKRTMPAVDVARRWYGIASALDNMFALSIRWSIVYPPNGALRCPHRHQQGRFRLLEIEEPAKIQLPL